MEGPSEEVRFYSVLSGFMSLLESTVFDLFSAQKTTLHPDKVRIASKYISGQLKNKLIENFVVNSEKYWGRIKERDEPYFFERIDEIFGSDTFKEEMAPVKKIFADNLVSDDVKTSFWKFMDSLIKISIKYIHRERVGILKDGQEIYLGSCMDFCNVKEHADNWGVKLYFNSVGNV